MGRAESHDRRLEDDVGADVDPAQFTWLVWFDDLADGVGQVLINVEPLVVEGLQAGGGQPADRVAVQFDYRFLHDPVDGTTQRLGRLQLQLLRFGERVGVYLIVGEGVWGDCFGDESFVGNHDGPRFSRRG